MIDWLIDCRFEDKKDYENEIWFKVSLLIVKKCDFPQDFDTLAAYSVYSHVTFLAIMIIWSISLYFQN